MTDRLLRLLILALLLAFAPAASAADPTTPLRWTTPQGSQVLFVPRTHWPMFDLRVVLPAGSARDDGASGLAQLTQGLVDAEVAGKGHPQILDAFDAQGARYDKWLGREQATFALRSLSDEGRRQANVTLFAEVLGRPLFTAEALARVKGQQQGLIDQHAADADERASQQLHQHLFANHPYATPVAGQIDALQGITREQVQTFHQRAYSAANAQIILVGDLDEATARQVAEAVSAALPTSPALADLPAAPATEAEIYHLEQDSTQVALSFALPTPAAGHPDLAALELASQMLAGDHSRSRLMALLREELGLTYGVSASLISRRSGGFWVLETSVEGVYRDAVQALVEQRLQAFIDQGPTAQELEAVRVRVLGQRQLALLSNAGMVEALAIPGPPTEQLQAVTLDTLRAALQKHWDMNKLVRVSVGPSVAQQPLPGPAITGLSLD